MLFVLLILLEEMEPVTPRQNVQQKGDPEVGHVHHLLVFVVSLKNPAERQPQKTAPTLRQLTEPWGQLANYLCARVLLRYVK